jgi:PAS domain S-box-containing protein
MELPLIPGVDALLAARPQTRELHIVSGASDFDRSLHAAALGQCSRYAGRLKIVSCAGQSLQETTRRLAALPPDAAVLYLSYFLSPAGENTLPFEVAAAVAKAAAAPVIVPYETYLGTGVLGGCVAPFEDQGRDLAAVIRRLAAGEPAASIGIRPPTRPRLVFDSRQLKRWGISAASLPAGSELRYRTPSIWEQHRGLVIAGGAVVLVQSGLIIALLILRARHLRAEKKLRQSDQRFAGIFRGSPAAISIVRQRDGRIVDVNPSWETFFEIPRADALGSTPAELEILANPESEQQYLEVLGSGRFLQSYEQRVRTRSGKERWRSVTIDLITLGGEPCIVAMAKDVTERREMEQARERLTQAMRLASLGELAASIAHEVNQPLGAILSNAETAELLMAGDHPPLDELRQILADIRRDDLRAGEVVKRVRSLVGRDQTAMVPLDLNDSTASVVRLIAHDASRRGVTVRREPAAILPPVYGDRVQIEQLLLNLLLNAMDAMQDTPLDQRLVTLGATAGNDGWVEISVADRGHGISPGRIDRVFDSFFTTKEGGMGLGLALARSIAETHGGRLTCANQPAGGAVFRLILPAIDLSSSHDPARSGVPDGSFGG